jgi:hypothetical protein
VVRAPDCQCILRHIGIWGAADEAVLNKVHLKKWKIFLFSFACIFGGLFLVQKISAAWKGKEQVVKTLLHKEPV